MGPTWTTASSIDDGMIYKTSRGIANIYNRQQLRIIRRRINEENEFRRVRIPDLEVAYRQNIRLKLG